MYLILKHLHLTAVALSGLFFLVRGVWLMQSPERLQAKWVRISPHIIDTVLLLSAIGMLVSAGMFPAWVHVKIALLVVYIGLGVMAFRKAKTSGQKAGFLLAAITVYLFIVSVAITKSPLGIFG